MILIKSIRSRLPALGLIAGLLSTTSLTFFAQAVQAQSADTSVASVNGKYSDLIQVVNCPEDRANYGEFIDWGYWSGTSWCGQVTQPGYWVWVNPNWYIWQNVGIARPENPVPSPIVPENPILSPEIDDRGRELHTNGFWDSPFQDFTIQAGQGVNIVMRNNNIIPLDICIADITWSEGEQQCTTIPSYGERAILFTKFGENPITWRFRVTSSLGRETTFSVAYWIYSTWVPHESPRLE